MQQTTSLAACEEPGHEPEIVALGGGAAAHLLRGRGRTVVCLHGEIDIGTDNVLAAALLEAAGTTEGDVVVDLGDVGFMGSSGLVVLLRQRSHLEAAGRSMHVRAPAPPVRRLFELAGSSDLLAGTP